MFASKKFETLLGSKKLIVEIGKYCSQSNGSCIVSCGDSIVMVNVTMSKSPREGINFLPLSVDYEEKMYAIGRIPGSFKRREGRPNDKAILTSRLIDRPLRPLFPKGFYNDISIICTVLSADLDCSPEVLGMIGSSIALSISDIPFNEPTGSVLVGMVDNKFVVNPNLQERSNSKLNLYVSGTNEALMMVEAGAEFITESQMLDAISFAHEEIKKQVNFIKQITTKIGKPKLDIKNHIILEEINNNVRNYIEKLIDNALDTFDRLERQKRQEEVENKTLEEFQSKYPDNLEDIKYVIYNVTKEKIRYKILNQGIRPDGRKLDEIRKIWCEVGILPRVHGSAVFTRGLSQALTTTTLGSVADLQKLDNLDDETFKRYMHHYNFPPYSTGEAKPLRAPSRREIGHGALAERALEPVIPSEEEFPYVIRTVSEILSSNGSTSQASVCGSTLSLMDAGVPIKAPVAGIAMGLVKEEEKIAILSDIQGIEDFFGDMDFKVAGTKDGITAIQMDIKIKGITFNILKQALEQAHVGRLYILNQMLKVLDKPREQLSKYAPIIISFKINQDKIGDVIGKNGKIINKIIETYNIKVDIEDDGTVNIITDEKENALKAKKTILLITKEPKKGDLIEGEVVEITNFGAFVSYAPFKKGMIHISKISKDQHVSKIEDYLKIGDKVLTEVLKYDSTKEKLELKLKSKL